MKMKCQLMLVPFFLIAICDSRKDPRRERSRHSGRRAVREDSPQTDRGTCELEISCKGDPTVTAPVKLPIKGPRGPGGKAGEKGSPGEAGIPGEPGIPGKSAPVTPKVAFFVGLGDNLGPVEVNTDLIFDKVITNVGGAYSNETGRFVAPVTGTYHFTVVVAAQGYKKAAAILMKQGQMVETIWAESYPYWATSSNSAILNLLSGEQVWLMLDKRASYIHGYMYSSFSGYLLFNSDDI